MHRSENTAFGITSWRSVASIEKNYLARDLNIYRISVELQTSSSNFSELHSCRLDVFYLTLSNSKPDYGVKLKSKSSVKICSVGKVKLD